MKKISAKFEFIRDNTCVVLEVNYRTKMFTVLTNDNNTTFRFANSNAYEKSKRVASLIIEAIEFAERELHDFEICPD